LYDVGDTVVSRDRGRSAGGYRTRGNLEASSTPEGIQGLLGCIRQPHPETDVRCATGGAGSGGTPVRRGGYLAVDDELVG
jgi:hypothetical protein